ncbi:phosphatidylethanolamine-binding protein homolog F40A3.3-like isoform X1 [Planococcus citri]|uniref:phosphatidylethanolamine-binding protein homolog F40A3.3-like isoform X1 n=1 Tax=Planococcus citri TaxID=170843 RepID=UPI0031F86D26
MKIVLIYFLTIVLQIPFTTAGRNAKLKQRFTYQTSKRTGNTKPKYPKTFTPTEIPSELGRKMLKHKLYPRLLHILPQKRCDVLYHHGAKADAGNVLNFNDIKEAPNVTWEADPEQSYTLIFRDADDDQEKSASQGWLIINIPGNDVASGSVVHDYKLPALPKSGPHHFVFLVYRQFFQKLLLVNVVDFIKLNSKFDVNSFISTFKLLEPGFGNFFVVNYESSKKKLKYTTRNWTLEYFEGTDPLPFADSALKARAGDGLIY